MRKLRIEIAAETPALRRLIQESLFRADVSILDLTEEALFAGLAKEPPDAVIIAFENKGYFEKTYTAVSLSCQNVPRILCVADGDMIEADLRRYKTCEWLALPKNASESKESFMKLLLSRLSLEDTGKSQRKNTDNPQSRFLIGIGCSAGGPKALLTVLSSLPEETCAILVVQHLTSGFSGKFAEYMDHQCRMKVTEARNGTFARDGTVYLASDGCQLSVTSWGNGFMLKNLPGKKVNGFAPSVDHLFFSLAQTAGKRAMGIILTGMGDDGARGLVKMRQAGAYTIAQDRQTSELYSMPGSAVSYGGTNEQVPLGGISGEIIRYNKRMRLQE